MASDKLYKLASEYYKLKLWNDLSEDQIFGVRLTDGRIAYCSVNGYEEGDRIALAVFVGSENFDSHRNSEMHFIDISRNEEFLLTAAQDCLECIFETKDGLSDEELAEEKSFSKRNKIYFRARNDFVCILKHRKGGTRKKQQPSQILAEYSGINKLKRKKWQKSRSKSLLPLPNNRFEK